MIPENLRRARRLFWLGRFLLAVGAIVLPAFSYFLARVAVEGEAKPEYFEAVSQILPVLLLALAIEQRYFNRRQAIPELPPELEFGEAEFARLNRLYSVSARIYALTVLLMLGLGEWIAVEVLATGESSATDLQKTAGSLAAGFTALIITALIGTKQTVD